MWAQASGAFIVIVIVYGINQRYGLANLLIATSLAGVLLFLLGPASAALECRPAPIGAQVSLTLLSVWLQLPVETIGTSSRGCASSARHTAPSCSAPRGWTHCTSCCACFNAETLRSCWPT